MIVQKNKEIPLIITGVTGEGNGVGRYGGDETENGIAVFVPFTAVGDVITCRIQKVEKRFAFGRTTEIQEPSADRCDDRDCDVYGKCGGCVWRHISYEAEMQYKWQKVKDALSRIGGLSIDPQPIVGACHTDRYRNKAQYPVGLVDGELTAGFYAPRSHRVVGHTDCPLQPAFFGDIVCEILQWMKENGISPYDEKTRKGLIRHIYIRHGEKAGDVMVCLVATSGKIPASDDLVARLKKAVDGLKTVVVNINKEDTNVILGDREYTLYGDGYITDILCGLKFKLSPRSFYQVNREQTEKLYRLAAKEAALDGSQVLIDLYCGTGTIGLTMADQVRSLIGVDIVAPAIEDAKENALQNGVTNARFICADAAKAAIQLQKEGVKPDVVLIDPPRKGCEESLIETIVEMTPQKVVYVSCDPATLARDLRRFAEKGYETLRVTPVDLFPGTMHCESVAVLYRKGEFV